MEIGFFGQRSRTSSAELSAPARLTFFMSRRFALELEQNLLNLRTKPSDSGAWAIYALPFGALRVHTGIGMTLRERAIPPLQVKGLVGGRMNLHDWLGVRLDAEISPPSRGDSTEARSAPRLALLGGFSIRLR